MFLLALANSVLVTSLPIGRDKSRLKASRESVCSCTPMGLETMGVQYIKIACKLLAYL